MCMCVTAKKEPDLTASFSDQKNQRYLKKFNLDLSVLFWVSALENFLVEGSRLKIIICTEKESQSYFSHFILNLLKSTFSKAKKPWK